MLRDERWPVARLIPITSATGVEARERNAASALLAVISVVEEFGRSLLKPLGAPVGKIETFVEVPFKLESGHKIRPDGLIGVSRAGKTWWCLVECKVADQQLTIEQMEMYLDLARTNSIDAVLSISNHYATKSSAYPIELDRKKLRKTAIHHWSWVRVLTEAEVQKQYRGVKDIEQAYILGELIRYLSDNRSGVVQFNDMGGSWTAVRDGARLHTLRKSDPNVAAVASRWDELIQYLVLHLTRDLGRDVRQLLARQENTSATRHQALKEALVGRGQLYAQLQIPHTAGPLEILVDLIARQITIATELEAPKDGKSRGRVGWLMRQMAKAPADVTIESRISRTSTTLAGVLGALRVDSTPLLPDPTREIRGFRVSLTRDLGMKRMAGRGAFIDSVIDAVTLYYRDVLQNLTAWHARPPKLRTTEGPIETEATLVPPPIDAALDQAATEALNADD
ncbi:MAG: hypothetical protein M3406_15560 [Chloroflexota bacterium]|nr:hypothetical protein [Chloroflexota bacterium]